MTHIIIVAMLTIIASCQKKEETEKNFDIENSVISEMTEDAPATIDKETTQKLFEMISFKLGDPIILDNPKRFIEITILFTLSQYSNYAEAVKKNISEEELGILLNKKREGFYQKLGISENEYVQYSIDNSEKIQDFLANNSNYAHAYDLIFSQFIE
ncbi:MAG: hypothetical protein ACRCV0_02125 [Brevinema sp.]